MRQKESRAMRKGSAIIVALGLGFVLLLIISGVYTFTSYRIQNTIQESVNLKALAIAEAGISCALTELSQNFGFRTHKVNRDLSWGAAESNTQSLSPNTAFKFNIDSNANGTYGGTIGEGEFRVRVGLIPLEDDPRTLNIDERFSFFKIEAMGKVQNTIRYIKGFVQRRFPGREFLMYDSDFLSIVFGEPGVNNVNKFMIGRLYGHKGLEIGQILNTRQSACSPGTKQQIMNIDLISSGGGGVFIYNDTKMSFRDSPTTLRVFPKNIDFPRSGTYSSDDARQHGEYPREMRDSAPPAIPEEFKKFVKNKATGANSIELKPIIFPDYEKQAQSGGKVISYGDTTSEAPDKDYKMPPGWGTPSEKCKVLDFGSNTHDGKAKNLNPGNGVIYSNDNIIVKGNPPKDLKIVSKKNIFICGDLNQAGQWKQSGFSDVKSERYGLPQNYKGSAVADDPNDPTIGDYRDDSSLGEPGPKKKLMDDTQATTFRNHKALTLIAQERVVYDYRSPVDCFENELYPFMKYKLGAALKNNTAAELAILKVGGSGEITSDVADKAAAKSRVIASFFNEFPMNSTTDQEALADEVANKLDSGMKLTDAALEEVSAKIWAKYAENYEKTPSNINDANYGVYKLLTALITKVKSSTTDKDDDYIYFPEMTVNGMIVSCAKRNTSFYAGPDYSKSYDEIGRKDIPGIGREYADIKDVIQRIYGSETRYSNFDVHRIGVGDQYAPMTRRKIYDESLPTLGLNTPGGTARDNEIAAFVLLSWRDYRATPEDYTAFSRNN